MDKQMTTCSCANPDCLEKGCQLQADLDKARARAEKAEANYAFMVERAVNEKLDGYQELGARAASAENEADRLRARLRETAKILITEVGADGPMDAEDVARRAVERMVTLRTLADEKAAEAGLYARRMEQAQRSRDAEREGIVAFLRARANAPHPIECGVPALSPAGRGLLLLMADKIERGEDREDVETKR